jgi:DNA-binding transcriptional ArsR family regulator
MSTEATALDLTLAALADPVRRRATELLASGPRRSGELAEQLGVSASVMSKHLRVLRHSGLVSESHPDFDARVRVYALEAAGMAGLRTWLETAEKGWAEQLTAFRDRVERRS